jgi:hypothetical protein
LAALAALLAGCISRGDSLAPVITVTEPRSSAVRSGDDVRVVGYVLDDVGIASLQVDGTDLLADPAFASERGKRLINFGFRPRQLAEGTWRPRITATDVNGRTTTLELPLEVDGTPPTIEITAVESLGGGRSRVSGVVRDDDAVGSITVNGVALSFTPAPEVTFTQDIEGPLVIEVADQAGNRATLGP